MTAKEAKTIKIGDLVSPIYGFDKNIIHVVTEIWINPYRTNTLEMQITAVPIEPEQVQSDWKEHGLRRCNQQGWKLLSGGKEMEKQIIFTEKELIRMLRGDSVKLIDGDMKTRFYMEDCDEPEPQKTPNELRELFGLSQI